MALALLILLGTVACSNSSQSDLTSDSSSVGGEVADPVSIEKPSAPPSPVSPSTETPVDSPPALPTPPIPPDAATLLEIAHQNYAMYLNSVSVDVEKVRMKWEEQVDPITPDKITKNIVYLNIFFSFVYEVDPQTRIGLGLVKSNLQVARESFEKYDFEKFNRSLVAAIQINTLVRERIAKAAQIYGVALSESPPVSSANLQDLIIRRPGGR